MRVPDTMITLDRQADGSRIRNRQCMEYYVMWHTSEGDRVLEGAEAALFKAGVISIVEQIKDEANYSGFGYSIGLFNELTWSQRLAVIQTVTTSLLNSNESAPRLSAVNEAAIAAVFEHISYQIDVEIDDEPAGNGWRQLLLDACNEAFGVINFDADEANNENQEEESQTIPSSASCERRDLWHPLVQSLADRILWDRDFEMMDEFLDEPPEKAAVLRQIMGIDDEYFATAAEDLNSLEEVGETLCRLTEVLK